MAKGIHTRFVCRNCGFESAKWLGKCPSCEEWGTLEEIVATQSAQQIGSRQNGHGSIGRSVPVRLSDVPSPEGEGRIKTGIGEFDRVLGGGIVRGALILIGGDPGIGKSTLLTQVAGHLAEHGGKTLYVSGEESAAQIKLRASRLGVKAADLLLHNETDVTLIAATAQAERPAFLIVDSIQTMQHPEIESAPGSVSQVRAATAALAQVAKGDGIPIFLVGHVTKEGALAGPRVLEHMVDTVLTFEGDRHYAYRILRAVKNRFGSTDELGLFEMHEEGLVEVPNPSEMLLSERTQNVAGSAVTGIVEGTRPLLVEVQALVAPSYLTNPRRTVSGVDVNRVNLILAVLEKRVGMSLASQDVFVNIAGGVRVDEPAADLAIAVAAASNFQETPVDPAVMLAGEVGLGGEVRAVAQIEKRLREAGRMGFTRAIVCAKNKAGLRVASLGLTVIGVENVRQALDAALIRP
jgi:DNA repair protein RadA/Sms